MATISPESRTRPAADSDPKPAETTQDQADETVESQTSPSASNGRHRQTTGFDIGEWSPVPTEEIDNVIVGLHELQKKIDSLNHRRLWLLKNKHQPAAKAMKRKHQLKIEYTNTEGVTHKPIRKAQIFHNEFQPLQDYLSLIETDQKENQARIESLLEEAPSQQTENEGETPDSQPNGGRSLAEITSELNEARQTDEWYVAEKRSTNDRLDDINRQIREQPEIAEPLQECEEILSRLQANEDDLKAAEALAIRSDPELAQAMAELNQARQDSDQVQAQIKRIGPGISPEDSERIQEVLDCWCIDTKPEEINNWRRDPLITPEARQVNELLLGNNWRQSVPRPNPGYYRFKQLLENRGNAPDGTKEGRL